MTGWLRRNLIPAGGMIVAIAFVGWLGWINVRGGSGAGVAVPSGTARASASATAAASATPTVNPDIAVVEGVAKGWIQAYNDAFRTGDASALHAMAVPDSQADGLAGTPRVTVVQTHHTVVVTAISFGSSSAQVVGDVGAVDVAFTTTGIPSLWPSLKPTGPAQTKQWTDHVELMRTNGRWLVSSFT